MPSTILVVLICLQTVLGNIGGYGANYPASLQLVLYKEKYKNAPNFTTSSGFPLSDRGAVITAGPIGPILMKDVAFIDMMQQFNRERIPERAVHAKGAGAYGKFKVTSTEITKYTRADLFSEMGKVTDVFVRFSTVAGELGSPDTVRSNRGFACKFYTQEGNWDLVALNTPVFFLREGSLFRSMQHATKRNPVTHCPDRAMLWDFFTLLPQTVFSMLVMQSSNGIPKTFRHMDGYGINAFLLYDKAGNSVYAKFTLETNQGHQNLTSAEGMRLAGSDPDYHVRDLYNSIAKGHYPSWKLVFQVMTFKQAQYVGFNPLDPTKVTSNVQLWPENEFPMKEIGELILDRNPKNFFAEVEQSAFCPSRLVPGIGMPSDNIFQTRGFSYTDTQIYRLGKNLDQIPVNKPYVRVANINRDGFSTVDGNQGGSPNYLPTSFNGPKPVKNTEAPPLPVYGNIAGYDTRNEDNFSHPKAFWNRISQAEKNTIVDNIVASLGEAPLFIQERAVKYYFSPVDKRLGEMLATRLGHSSKN